MKSILIENTGKSHPELDYEKCVELYASTQKKLDGETIGSPFDIYSVETIRKRLKFDSHASVPTDVFVWGEGEPPKPHLTKIGGLPYLPKDESWPSDAEGQPYVFVAQFCFADSKDIVSTSLPGDVLLMFVKHEGWDGEYLQCYESDDLHFEWIWIEDRPTWDRQSMEEKGFQFVDLSYFGVIYRTRDYDPTDEIEMKLDSAYEAKLLSATYLIPFVSGTKIGGYPYFIQNGPPGRSDYCTYNVKPKLKWDDAVYIGQFVSLQFASDVPYPWCNRNKPIGFDFKTDDSIYAKGKSLMIGDLGSIYLYLKPDGTVTWFEESY